MTTASEAALLHFESLLPIWGATGRYARSGLGEVEVDAVRCRAEVYGQNVEALNPLDSEMQWMFRASDLVLSSLPIEPEPYDTWTEQMADGSIRHYEVAPLGTSERIWEPSDHEGLLIRVWMKLQRTTMAPQ